KSMLRVDQAMEEEIELRDKVAELRKRKSNVPPALGVLSTFFFVGAGLWVLKNNFTWWLGVVVFILIGFMQYRLVLASHEAVHKNLFQPLWFNEAAGLVCASAVGVSLFNYRKASLDHQKAPKAIQ